MENTLDYCKLREEYKNIQKRERLTEKNNKSNDQDNKIVNADKSQNQKTKQEFWEYLNRCA